MHLLGLVFAALAGALHVAIFAMESLWWQRPSVWKRFGLASQEAADTTRPLAYNQGFYNLFLAIIVLAGIAADLLGSPAGMTMMLVALLSMVGAAVVLTTTGRGYLRSALTQGTLPALALIALAISSL